MQNKIQILRNCLFDVIQQNKQLQKENKQLKQKLKIKDTIIKKGGK